MLGGGILKALGGMQCMQECVGLVKNVGSWTGLCRSAGIWAGMQDPRQGFGRLGRGAWSNSGRARKVGL